MGYPSQNCWVSLAMMGSHSVTCYPTQANTSRWWYVHGAGSA